MVMTKNQEPLFTTPTAKAEMTRSCVAAGKPRKKGEIVELTEKEFRYMLNVGDIIPHLGEPTVKKRKKRAGK